MSETIESAAGRARIRKEINADPGSREALEAEHGQVWDTSQLQQDFAVKAFLAPIVSVTRKADGQKGSMFFQASPRFYFGFEPV